MFGRLKLAFEWYEANAFSRAFDKSDPFQVTDGQGNVFTITSRWQLAKLAWKVSR